MDSSVQSNLNSTLFDVQNTSEFQRLKQIEQEDLQELNKGISYINEEIFTEGTDYEEQIRILGEAIAVTLLAHDHRGGYGIDNNGLQTFKSDLQNDFGINLDEYAEVLGFTSSKNLLFSDRMKPYVKPDLNNDSKEVLRGKPFKNVLLAELLEDQKIGHNETEQKANQKAIERTVRLNAAKINPEAVEGRLRIYKIISELKHPGNWVSYQDVQLEYGKKHGFPLNKSEFKKFFGSGDVLITLKELAADDLDVMKDDKQTGTIFMRLKKDLNAIEATYKKMLNEVETLPTFQEITELKKKTEEEKRARPKPKKVDGSNAPNFVVDENSEKSQSALLVDSEDDLQFSSFAKKNQQNGASSSNKPEPSAQQKPKKNSAFTQHGVGEYSDTSDDEDEDEEENGVEKQLIVKAFVFGFLKSTHPLLCPIANLAVKAESYMASQNLKISKDEIESFVRSLRTELDFFSNDAYITLAKARK